LCAYSVPAETFSFIVCQFFVNRVE
jgi:hypothetical protein